jgi:poly(A) polymerase
MKLTQKTMHYFPGIFLQGRKLMQTMNLIQTNKILQNINQINNDCTCDNRIYLVGGFVRDLLLGKDCLDIDLLVIGRVKQLAMKVARELNAAFFPLDETHQIYRVVWKETSLQLDFAAPKGRNLAGEKALLNDLALRDFTVNAFALSLVDYLAGLREPNRVIDYHGGIVHLKKRLLHPLNSQTILDDPLRILRGVRLAGTHGFTLSNECISLMKSAREELARVSGERIKEELWQILALENCRDYVELLTKDLGVLPILMPEISQMDNTEQNHFHVENVWQHSLRVLGELETIIKDKEWPGKVACQIEKYLNAKINSGKSRMPLLKFSALFHDIGKIATQEKQANGRITFYNHHREGVPLVNDICQRLKLGSREAKLIKSLIGRHMEPLSLFHVFPLTTKAKNRFFYRCGEEALGVLILALADNAATYQASTEKYQLYEEKNNAPGATQVVPAFPAANKYQKFIHALLHDYITEEMQINQLPRLLTGRDIMEHFNIPQGKEIGRLLNKVKMAQIDGELTNRKEALDLINVLLRK